jgi:ornithine carbamoyltransferase
MRHFLTLTDWSTPELRDLLHSALWLKQEYRSGGNRPALAGKALVLLFERPSLRTRVSFEMAMKHLGGHTLTLHSHEIQLGQRETIADTVQVLAQYADIMMARVFDHSLLTEMAAHSPVPIINGLSAYAHPCQAMADVLTIYEEFGQLSGLQLAYLGNCRNDVTRSLLFAAARFGFRVRLCGPPEYAMDEESLQRARALGGEQTAQLVADSAEAVQGVDIIYTDAWVATTLPAEEAARRRHIFPPYQLHEALLARALPHTIVLHCMPANRGEEITDGVADGAAARLLPQAANRLHVQKAILARLLLG